MMLEQWFAQLSRVSGATGALVGLTGVGASHGSPQLGATAGAVLVCGALWRSRRRLQLLESGRRQDARLRAELASYVALSLPRAAERAALARSVVHLVAARSTFARAALLLRDASGLVSVAGSSGMDDLSVQSLNRWAASWSGQPEAAQRAFPAEARVSGDCFQVQLERRQAVGGETASTLACARVFVLPIRSTHGVIGILAVCAEPRVSALPVLPPSREAAHAGDGMPLAEVLSPLEALATRLSGHLADPHAHTARSQRPTLTLRQRPNHVPRAVQARTRGEEDDGEADSRRTLDRTDELQPAPISLRRLLELTAPPGTKLPKAATGVAGFVPARKW